MSTEKTVYPSKGEAVVVQSSTPDCQSGDGVHNDPTAPLTLWLVKVESPEQREEFNRITDTFHSYVPTHKPIGRHVDYLVKMGTKFVGAIGVSSLPIPLSKPILLYLKAQMEKVGIPITYKQYGAMKVVNIMPVFNQTANNWRFTLSPDAPHNCGSKVLKCLRVVAPRDWKTKYGDNLNWLITFVHPSKKGTVYKADGWVFVGWSSKASPGFGRAGTASYRATNTAKQIREQTGKRVATVQSIPKMIFVRSLLR